ncbi:MAG TPA: cytochrome c3 family protein [Geminicoccaceae bacterium]|nr:cytochrome c3 family protein [Geminicoccaceae bacterium]
MRCKVRYLSRARSGGVAQTERVIDVQGRRVRLGRDPKSDVVLKDLRVNYRHADVVVRDYDVVIESVGGSPLRVDGVPVERAVMTADAEIEVGAYRVQLVPRVPGADLALAVELVAPPPVDAAEGFVEPRRVQLGGGLLRKRPLSWLLFLVVVAFALALPILAHRPPEPGTVPQPGWAPDHLLTGFDRVWTSGELSSSHKLLANNCGACHVTPFVPVRSEDCAGCHARIRHHFDTARFQFAGFAPTGCMGCHSEHRGPGGVVPARQALCADCHRDLSREQPETTLLDAADFGAAHPEFRPSVIVDPADGARIERVSLGAPDFPRENSNLRFPHAIHLAETCGVPGAAPGSTAADLTPEARRACTVRQMARQRMDRDGLGCGDCHRPRPGGVTMLPVRMRDHCAACHRLEFDPEAPDRVLPHGDPVEVIAVINDYYAAEALRGGVAIEASPTGARQRPGGPAVAPTEPARRRPVREAEDKAAQKLDAVFGRSLCGVCHETIPPAESERGKWGVRPVRVAALWMPKARFDHAAHATIPCTDCHRAPESMTSGDVLMPAIEDCRTCHRGEHATTALPSTCITCHAYHGEDLTAMLPRPVDAPTSGQLPADAVEP